MNSTPPESPDRRRVPGGQNQFVQRSPYRFPQQSTAQQFAPTRAPGRSRAAPSRPQLLTARPSTKGFTTDVSGGVGLNPRSAWSGDGNKASTRVIAVGRGAGARPLLDLAGNPVSDFGEAAADTEAETQENWENYEAGQAEEEATEESTELADADEEVPANPGSPALDGDSGRTESEVASPTSLLSMAMDADFSNSSLTLTNASPSSPASSSPMSKSYDREREAKALFESNGVSLTEFLRAGSSNLAVPDDASLMSPSESGTSSSGPSGAASRARGRRSDNSSGVSGVEDAVDEDDGEEVGREAIAVLSGEQVPGVINSEPAPSPGGTIRDSDMMRTNVDSAGSAVSLASHHHVMQATKAARKAKEEQAKERQKDAILTREWRGLEIENLDLSGLSLTPSTKALAATAIVTKEKPEVSLKGNPIVEVQRVSLLYDPPVEVCQLKPYVSLRTADGQTMALRNDKESLRWVEFRWFRGQRRVCNKPNCGQGATLQCLDCVKRNVPVHLSFYCSDDCMREMWAEHSKLHKQPLQAKPKLIWNDEDGEDFKGKKQPETDQNVHCKFPPPIPNTWSEVSRSRAYTPVTDDVGRALRLEVAPVIWSSSSSSSTSSSSSSSSSSSASAASSPVIAPAPGSSSPVNANNYHDSTAASLTAASASEELTDISYALGGSGHGDEDEDEEDESSNVYLELNSASASSAPSAKQSPMKYVKKEDTKKRIEAKKTDDNAKKSFGKWHRLETSPVIPAPLAPPARRLRYNNPTNSSGHPFKCVCYNVLADIYATKHFFPYCKVWALSWSFRKAQLMREILSHQADVICLQEVQANHFEKWFQPNLHKAGYDGIFKKKTRESVTDNPNTIDGCAIFYKRDRFALMEQYGIEFNEAARQQTSDRRALRRLLKGNIALVVVLEDIGGDSSRASANARRRRKRRVCIANTHIHWDPECADVKLWQSFILLQELEKLVMHRNLPLVLCGDFNSMTDSSVFELLTTERVDSKHRIFRNDPYQILPDPTVMTHRLPLTSAYGSIGELKYTNYTGHFVGTLDYIFYSKNHLVHHSVLDSDKEDVLKRHTALPSPQFSSDHICLVTELDWMADSS